MRVLLALPFFLLGSCYDDDLKGLTKRLDIVEWQLKSVQEEQKQHKATLEDFHGQLNAVSSNALCGPEVQQIVLDVTKGCANSEFCVDANIAGLVTQNDPDGQGRFISLMLSQPGAAFYPTSPLPQRSRRAGGKKAQPADSADLMIDTEQTDRLTKLVEPPWLSTTRFLIVANSGPSRQEEAAKQRALFVEKKLSDMHFAGFDEHLQIRKQKLLKWVFPFKVQQREHLRIMDQPPRSSSINDSVWVFRINCRLSEEQKRPGKPQ